MPWDSCGSTKLRNREVQLKLAIPPSCRLRISLVVYQSPGCPKWFSDANDFSKIPGWVTEQVLSVEFFYEFSKLDGVLLSD